MVHTWVQMPFPLPKTAPLTNASPGRPPAPQIADVAEKLEQAESSLAHGARLGRWATGGLGRAGAVGEAAGRGTGDTVLVGGGARDRGYVLGVTAWGDCDGVCIRRPCRVGSVRYAPHSLAVQHVIFIRKSRQACAADHHNLPTQNLTTHFRAHKLANRYFEKKKPATSGSGAAGGGGGGEESALARICRDTSKLAAEQIKGLSTQVRAPRGRRVACWTGGNRRRGLRRGRARARASERDPVSASKAFGCVSNVADLV